VKYLLDANAVISLLRGHPAIAARARRRPTSDFGIPAVVAHELYFGAYRGDRIAESLSKIEAMAFEVLDFDREDAHQAARIRAALASAGKPIGGYDILIAGQTMARGLVLITHNTDEFSRVAGLQIEDWEL